MERLRYEKIAESVISVDLHCGYTIVALRQWVKNKKCYIVTLYLKDNTVDFLDLMEELENVKVFVDSKDERTVNREIAQKITELYDSGQCAKYIERYEYTMRSFNIGNEILAAKERG